MADKIRNVEVRDVECDEVWSFIGKNNKRVRPEDNQLLGDCYVWVGIERHSKLVLNIAIGKRDQVTADTFIEGLLQATSRKRFQITTDGFAAYKNAIKAHCTTVATSPSSSRSTAPRAKAKAATAPPK